MVLQSSHMKTIIYYTSMTGNTKRYAEDIAKGVGGEALPLKGRKWYKQALDADCIVYGGYVEGGIIKGIDKFLREYDRFEGKNIIIYAVGMAIPTSEGRKDLISMNLLDQYHVRFYQFQGGFDINKLKFPASMMMKMALKKMMNNVDNPAESSLGAAALNKIEYYDQAKVDRVIYVIDSLSLEVHKA